MALDNYDDLQASIQRFLKRQDLSALMPDFISIAENHFNRNIYTLQRRTTFTYTPTSNVINLPTDYYRIVRLYYNGVTVPFFENDAQSGYANGNANTIGYGYQLIGGKISLSVPQLGQQMLLDYYTTIEPLSETNQSNWLLEDASDVYLYGALHEAAVYIRDDTRMQLWLQKRDAAIADLVNDDAMSRYPEQPLAIRRA